MFEPYVFVCKVCEKEFTVPYFRGEVNTPPEMIRVIEHEDEHIAKDEPPDWTIKNVEIPAG